MKDIKKSVSGLEEIKTALTESDILNPHLN